jgi:glycosyltransferase involved in cell wall biosynthesis
MEVCLVHDWLTGMRGGERVLEVLCELYPEAPLYTLIWNKGTVSSVIEERDIHTSALQHAPFAAKHYRWYLPFFPLFVGMLDLSPYDLVISTSHCVAKGVRLRERALHVSYIHAPMRYAWDKYFDYFLNDGGLGGPRGVRNMLLNRLRRWDYSTSRRVDYFIANSNNIARKVRSFYDRDAEVIPPPVDCSRFTPGGEAGGFYLYVGAFVPYKRVDLVVEACKRLKRRLVVVGGGQGERAARRLAGGCDWIQFLGWKGTDELVSYYRGCRALLFPADEDFGIAPLEAMACGKPVVAYGRGGALESMSDRGEVDGPLVRPVRVTGGVLFPEQRVESLMAGMALLEAESYDPERLRRRAEEYDRALFKEKIRKAIEGKLAKSTLSLGTRGHP